MTTKLLTLSVTLFMASGCTPGIVKTLTDTQKDIQHLEEDVKTSNRLVAELSAEIKEDKANTEMKLKAAEDEVQKLKVELEKRQVISELSNEDLIALARSEGVSAEARGDSVIAVVNQVRFQLSFSKRNHLLFARTIFNGIDNVMLANNINRKVAFGRAYINGSSLVFEAYVDIEAGVKPKFLQEWLATWKKHVILLKRGLIQYVQQQQQTGSGEM